MTPTAYILLCVIGAITVFGLGAALIDIYFRRKEQFVDKLQQKARGIEDGTC